MAAPSIEAPSRHPTVPKPHDAHACTRPLKPFLGPHSRCVRPSRRHSVGPFAQCAGEASYVVIASLSSPPHSAVEALYTGMLANVLEAPSRLPTVPSAVPPSPVSRPSVRPKVPSQVPHQRVPPARRRPGCQDRALTTSEISPRLEAPKTRRDGAAQDEPRDLPNTIITSAHTRRRPVRRTQQIHATLASPPATQSEANSPHQARPLSRLGPSLAPFLGPTHTPLPVRVQWNPTPRSPSSRPRSRVPLVRLPHRWG